MQRLERQPDRPGHRPVPGRLGRSGQGSTPRSGLRDGWHAGRGPVERQRPVGRCRRGGRAGEAVEHGRRDPGLSPGDNGDVEQSNSADADALAGNGNLTGQTIDQSQGGGGGTQVAGQDNDSDQSAHAGAAAVQEKPSNTAVGIRVLSPGDDGDVEQSNSADADAKAANGNLTARTSTRPRAAGRSVRDSDAASVGAVGRWHAGRRPVERQRPVGRCRRPRGAEASVEHGRRDPGVEPGRQR